MYSIKSNTLNWSKRHFSTRQHVTFSGIQPTGVPHLGNYLGALINWKKLQQTSNAVYCIVDLHALTMPGNGQMLQKNTLEMAASLLAIGIDPQRSLLYRQSAVLQHTNLAWIFMCITPVSWLTRMHQWKSKGKRNPDVGLLSYPILQAADILLFRATQVPVGEDQMQHLNLCRDLAIKFNHEFGETFPIPEALVSKDGCKRIMSLRDPNVKMSKSDAVDASRINLTDTPDLVRKKIAKAVTDSDGLITYSPSRSGVANLLHIYSTLEDVSIEASEAMFAKQTTRELKDAVTACINNHLAPIQSEYSRLKKDPEYLERILLAGEEAANAIADATMKDVACRVGTVVK
jgi:tryptophanyl-tRNA synthetase